MTMRQFEIEDRQRLAELKRKYDEMLSNISVMEEEIEALEEQHASKVRELRSIERGIDSIKEYIEAKKKKLIEYDRERASIYYRRSNDKSV